MFLNCSPSLMQLGTYYIFSWQARIGVSFLNQTYFDVNYDCYSDRFVEDKTYQIDCNFTNNEFWLKVPQEGTKKCVQVS